MRIDSTGCHLVYIYISGQPLYIYTVDRQIYVFVFFFSGRDLVVSLGFVLRPFSFGYLGLLFSLLFLCVYSLFYPFFLFFKVGLYHLLLLFQVQRLCITMCTISPRSLLYSLWRSFFFKIINFPFALQPPALKKNAISFHLFFQGIFANSHRLRSRQFYTLLAQKFLQYTCCVPNI